jgi:hypothetical protein
MTQEFKTYLETIIQMTCGFTPTIKVVELAPGTIQAFMEGTQEQQALMMGREGKTIGAITRFALIFGKRHNFFPYVYVRPRNQVDDNLAETLATGKFL